MAFSFRPVNLLKSLFGYGTGAEPGVIDPTKIDPIVKDGMFGAAYTKSMELKTDRTGLYNEMDQMDSDDIVESVLDLVTEDCSQQDLATNKTLWVESENKRIIQIGNDLLDDLQTEDEIFSVTRSMVKYGDAFYALVQEKKDDKTPGPVKLMKYHPPSTVFRHQDENTRLIGFNQGADKDEDNMVAPWSMLHFRLLGKKGSNIQYAQDGYGYAYLAPARRVYRRWKMMEDALAIYRIKRCPDRFKFGILGMDALAPEERASVFNHIRMGLRKKMLINPDTGEVRSEVDPMTIDEDYFYDPEAVQIDKIEGTKTVGHVLDVEYMRKRFFSCIKVPPDYLGFSDAKGGLLAASPLCFVGSTKISLADGRERTMLELLEEFGEDDKFWVYSCELPNRRIRPGLAYGVRKTGEKTETVIVELDNGEEVTCTPDHPFLLSSGEYIHASDLKSDDPLVALYKGVSDKHWNNITEKEEKGKIRRVVSVCEGPREDVYDFTVDKYHNFALSAGVFVHNSHQDVQFSRQCKRIKRSVSLGYLRLIQIHLCWNGIDPSVPDNEFTIGSVPVSYLDEIQRAQLYEIKAKVLAIMEDIGTALGFDREEFLPYLIQVAGLPKSLLDIGKDQGKGVTITGELLDSKKLVEIKKMFESTTLRQDFMGRLTEALKESLGDGRPVHRVESRRNMTWLQPVPVSSSGSVESTRLLEHWLKKEKLVLPKKK